ncbi:MAG: ABC transporter ATP-binding protein [Planctomycetota bacterium]|nr:MAG: ABC transporter ATP-binding protein [Planctomycetota bacterium]
MTCTLVVSGAHHAYGATPVLHGIDLCIQPGEIVCMLGPSGCGKTTLLRCVAGLEPLLSGTITLAGEEVSRCGHCVPPEQRGVGMVFQDFALFPHRDVRANVAFGLRGLSRSDAAQRINETLARVRAADLIDAWPHQLSGGQQQRVALARALAPRPRLMLMDEPFSGLDATLRRSLRDDARLLLKDVGIATLMVTHDGEEALQMADRIVLMNHGKMVLDGPPERVWRHPVDVFSATFFGDCSTTQGVVNDGGVRIGPLVVPADGLADGTPVTVVIRHTALRLRPMQGDASSTRLAEVIDERFLGGRRQTVVAIRHRGERLLLTSRHDNYHHFRRGEKVEMELAESGVFCFAD